MCEKCVEIDNQIGQLKWSAGAVDDDRTASGINELIQHEAKLRNDFFMISTNLAALTRPLVRAQDECFDE